ncbi:hypothetical protein [Pyxidicoccus sp. MSG2]|uniref:hypothetical protein n=1 Tax=Pyxidicoccus sp. MSG2 TaxID=2996790 RepID=UPI00226DB659|nr:hypothetical protein [Pyxidicoccus sp. MSG2]MCY1019317.1 hypothetical protein [Pyxidicoccus sp. MSG2]
MSPLKTSMTNDPPRTSPGRAAVLFAVTSGGAVLVGCLVAAAHAVPAVLWARNAGAWIVGALLATVLARTATQRAARVILPLAVAAIAATLLSSGLSGVHRWIGFGPVRLNAAELLLPMTLVAWAGVAVGRRPLWLSVPVLAIILALQPDASQAVALAGAAIAVLLAHPLPHSFRFMAAVIPVAAAVMAVFRPDPLQPVPEVEGIIGLALETSPALALLALVTLAGAVLSPLAAAGVSRAAALGLTVYLALCALAPWMGAFPVPLVGMGVSPILGAWCGIGLLVGLGRSSGHERHGGQPSNVSASSG